MVVVVVVVVRTCHEVFEGVLGQLMNIRSSSSGSQAEQSQ